MDRLPTRPRADFIGSSEVRDRVCLFDVLHFLSLQ